MNLTPHMKFIFRFNDINGILLKSIKASIIFDKGKLRHNSKLVKEMMTQIKNQKSAFLFYTHILTHQIQTYFFFPNHQIFKAS